MVHSVSRWTRGVQVKLWDPLRMRAIPERLRGVITTRRYTNTRLPLPLPIVRVCRDEMGLGKTLQCIALIWWVSFICALHTEILLTELQNVFCNRIIFCEKRMCVSANGQYYFLLLFISERELKFMFAICHRRSVCRLSSVCLSVVCDVRAPYSDDWNFPQCFYAVGCVGHLLTSR